MSENTKRIIVGEAIAVAAWLVVMLLLCKMFMYLPAFILSLIFGVFAFLVSILLLVLNDKDQRQAGALVEVWSLPIMVSVGYFALAIIANSLFCATAYLWLTCTVPIVVNVVLVAAAVILRMGVGHYQKTAEATVEKVAQQVHETSALGPYIAQLIAVAKDPAVKEELKRLKIDFDYSSNVANPAARSLESQFLSQLNAINTALARGDAQEEILVLIKQAKQTWRQRNAASAV